MENAPETQENGSSRSSPGWTKLEFPGGLRREGTQLSLQARVFKLNQLQLRNHGRNKKFTILGEESASEKESDKAGGCQ